MTEELTVHGGLDAAELRPLGLRPKDVLDFSANINPLALLPLCCRQHETLLL